MSECKQFGIPGRVDIEITPTVNNNPVYLKVSNPGSISAHSHVDGSSRVLLFMSVEQLRLVVNLGRAALRYYDKYQKENPHTKKKGKGK